MRRFSLGQFVSALERLDQKKPIRFDFGAFVPDGVASYRGNYADLAIGFKHWKEVTVAELLADCKDAIGNDFEGYKGGIYTMRGDSRLWVANYGESSGTVIKKIKLDEWQYVIMTGYEG